ncbi:MAG: fibronectin type III domain-containing protein, partial [Bacteroidales bacterium]
MNLSFAQVSPVYSYTTLYPPSPQQLSDLISANKIDLQIRLLDASVAQAQLQLCMIIEGNGIRISNSVKPSRPVYALQGGENLRLVSSDLAYYFSTDNLEVQGMQKKDFVKGGGWLPDGMYRIWFEVYEYVSGAKVSIQEVAANLTIFSQDPPLLNYPQNQSTVLANDFQNIQFQWTPRHLAAGSGAFNTEYILEIVQIPEKYQGDWKANFSFMPKFFVETSKVPFFIYTMAQPLLQCGYFYAYRVQVKCQTAMQEEMSFKNGGYSEIYSFFYKEDCPKVLNFTAKETGKYSAHIQWATNSKVQKYSFYMRKSGIADANWFTQEVQGPGQTHIELQELEPATSYECKLKAHCLYSESEPTPLQFFTTLDEDTTSFWCGKHKEYAFTNQNPLYLLQRFDQVKTSSGFIVTIEEVRGENGKFSGTAYTY